VEDGTIAFCGLGDGRRLPSGQRPANCEATLHPRPIGVREAVVRPLTMAGTTRGATVIKVIEDMPVGTIGLEASGKVTDDDYRDVLVPTVKAALEKGKVRLLYVLPEGFSYSPGAVWADSKLWFKDLKSWERVAIVSDADWLENAVEAFGWMMPGEIKVFESDEVRDAKAWLVGIDDDDD
jgi:SpoIIAA-like